MGKYNEYYTQLNDKIASPLKYLMKLLEVMTDTVLISLCLRFSLKIQFAKILGKSVTTKYFYT